MRLFDKRALKFTQTGGVGKDYSDCKSWNWHGVVTKFDAFIDRCKEDGYVIITFRNNLYAGIGNFG